MEEKRENLIKTLENIQVYFNARADMAIGDGKIVLAGYWKTIEEAIALLKAQEPVAPVKKSFVICGVDEYGATSLIPVCGACGAWLQTAAPVDKYCPQCGRTVKWDD